MRRSKVVLPQPLGPRRARTSPRATSRSAPSTAAVPAKRLLTSSQRSRFTTRVLATHEQQYGQRRGGEQQQRGERCPRELSLARRGPDRRRQRVEADRAQQQRHRQFLDRCEEHEQRARRGAREDLWRRDPQEGARGASTEAARHLFAVGVHLQQRGPRGAHRLGEEAHHVGEHEHAEALVDERQIARREEHEGERDRDGRERLLEVGRALEEAAGRPARRTDTLCEGQRRDCGDERGRSGGAHGVLDGGERESEVRAALDAARSQ